MSRILVVDDDRHVSRTVGWYLARAGHQVETETDGAIALDREWATNGPTRADLAAGT